MSPGEGDDETTPGRADRIALVALLAAAAVVRSWQLGRWSFWYDEVVTAHLARTPGPSALLDLLGRIDATRAPLHPLMLQGWIRVFGASEAACRSLSVVAGVLTVALMARLGRRFFHDPATGLIAAALAAVSPALVIYSRETRMYAWLVLLTCLAWDAAWPDPHARHPSRRWAVYVVALIALGYTHPLGLIMAATLALATLIERSRLTGLRPDGGPLAPGGWLLLHGLAAAAVLPWVPRYLDHPPESTVGVLPLKFLFGLPIGYLGGNALVLVPLVALIAWGVLCRGPGRGFGLDRPAGVWLLLWLVVPPTVLYAYSRLSHPIFGPERYTLFVAPAYLILVARGVARLPSGPRLLALAGALGLALVSLPARAFPPEARADWRAAAAYLDRVDPARRAPVVVATTAESGRVEIETARYYLGDRPVAAQVGLDPPEILGRSTGRVWYAVGLRRGEPVAPLPPAAARGTIVRFAGLTLSGVDPPGAAD